MKSIRYQGDWRSVGWLGSWRDEVILVDIRWESEGLNADDMMSRVSPAPVGVTNEQLRFNGGASRGAGRVAIRRCDNGRLRRHERLVVLRDAAACGFGFAAEAFSAWQN